MRGSSLSALCMNRFYKLPCPSQVVGPEKEQHLFGIINILPQVLQIQSLLGMPGSVRLQYLFNLFCLHASQSCQYMCHMSSLPDSP